MVSPSTRSGGIILAHSSGIPPAGATDAQTIEPMTGGSGMRERTPRSGRRREGMVLDIA